MPERSRNASFYAGNNQLGGFIPLCEVAVDEWSELISTPVYESVICIVEETVRREIGRPYISLPHAEQALSVPSWMCPNFEGFPGYPKPSVLTMVIEGSPGKQRLDEYSTRLRRSGVTRVVSEH